MTELDKSRDIFKRNKEQYLADFQTLLRFPSISSLQEHSRDCNLCAAWLRAHLEKIGFEARLIQLDANPAVFAHRPAKKGKPTILIYGHYDVQPVGNVEDWMSPPFEPTFKNSRVYARGARDNKGQHFFALKAIESLIQEQALDCGIKILLDGEEEIGSPGLFKKYSELKEELNSDIVLAFETPGAPNGDPAITAGLRGAISIKLKLSGARKELHSGNHGGRIRNPAVELCRILATLHNADSSIAVKDFYDGVLARSDLERRLANESGFDLPEYLKDLQLDSLGGEEGYTPMELVGFRPTIEINGISSGYTGEGIKTAIPSYALATLSSRIVPGQEPNRCYELIVNHLLERVRPGVRLSIEECSIKTPAFHLDINSDLVRKACSSLGLVCKSEPTFLWSGASVPMISTMMSINPEAEALLVGFGRDEDNEHSPNESFSMEQFENGYIFTRSFLTAI